MLGTGELAAATGAATSVLLVVADWCSALLLADWAGLPRVCSSWSPDCWAACCPASAKGLP